LVEIRMCEGLEKKFYQQWSIGRTVCCECIEVLTPGDNPLLFGFAGMCKEPLAMVERYALVVVPMDLENGDRSMAADIVVWAVVFVDDQPV
jgi:hypothetical protein